MTIPDDFADNWQIMAREELAEHYGIRTNMVTNICRHLGLKRPHGVKVHKKPKDIPANFAQVINLPEDVLASRFGCYVKDVRQWRRRLGYQPNPAHKVEPAAPIVFRDATLAAKHLQYYGAISRCDENGNLGRGSCWMRGNKVKTDAEIIELAIMKGWDAGEWRRVVA